MQILWLDPFFGGSHAALARGFTRHSAHDVTLLTLDQAGGWRWRMRGAALTLARLTLERGLQPDLILTTDMLDLATYRALTARQLAQVPMAVYFHENQLTYPLPAGRKRDVSFAWINLTSALAADAVIFNSAFHRDELLTAWPAWLRRHHDWQELEQLAQLPQRSYVLPPGLDLPPPRRCRSVGEPPVLLWNARWEYDKQPQVVMAALEQLAAAGIDFRLIVVGEQIDPTMADLTAARQRWADRTLHWGYAPTRAEYCELLARADVVISAAVQEFFGIAIVEAMAAGCVPLLPRRLNYPALIPADRQADCLYDHDDDLAAALLRLLTKLPQLAALDWYAAVADYDWAVQAAAYDQLLAQIAARSVV
jgi:glycosyltransferase involved in cell wall biosynthesis